MGSGTMGTALWIIQGPSEQESFKRNDQKIPVAAACLFARMLGAAAVHARRKESPVPPLVLGVFAMAIAIGRITLPR